MAFRRLRRAGDILLPPAARQVAAPIILLVILMYDYINGPLIFGSLWSAPGFSNAILAYILFVFGGLLLAALPVPWANKELLLPPRSPLWQQLLVYIGVALVVNVAIILGGLRLFPATADVLQVILFQIAVTGAEELFFRGALFKTGPLVSTAAFALFHAYVYNFAIPSLVFAAVAGVALYYTYSATKERFGLAVNTAGHLGYNLALLSIFLFAPLAPLLGLF